MLGFLMTFIIQTFENFVWFRFLARLYSHWHSGSKIFDFFKNIMWFIFLMLYIKALNDCSLGKQSVLFPLNLRISLDVGSSHYVYIIYPPNFLHRHCFIVSWDFQYYCCPKRSKDNSYVKFLGVNNVYYWGLENSKYIYLS